MMALNRQILICEGFKFCFQCNKVTQTFATNVWKPLRTTLAQQNIHVNALNVEI